MCKECQKLIELYARTQLECIKRSLFIGRVMVDACYKCGNNIWTIADVVKEDRIDDYIANAMKEERENHK